MAPKQARKAAPASAAAVSSAVMQSLLRGPQPRAPPAALDTHSNSILDALGVGADSSNNNTAIPGYDASPLGQSDDDDDDDDDQDEADGAGNTPAARKGKGKAANKKAKPADPASAAARKAANRLAQRDFRQRKQQYIRALETRVDLLSSDQNTQVDRLRWAVRQLLTENNQLRSVVASLASFIGNPAIGGVLASAGVGRQQLHDIINERSEQQLADGFAQLPVTEHASQVLAEIRKETNIPLEGLPESLPRFAGNHQQGSHEPSSASSSSFGHNNGVHDSSTSRKRKTTSSTSSSELALITNSADPTGEKDPKRSRTLEPQNAGVGPLFNHSNGRIQMGATFRNNANVNPNAQPLGSSPATNSATTSASASASPQDAINNNNGMPRISPHSAPSMHSNVDAAVSRIDFGRSTIDLMGMGILDMAAQNNGGGGGGGGGYPPSTGTYLSGMMSNGGGPGTGDLSSASYLTAPPTAAPGGGGNNGPSGSTPSTAAMNDFFSAYGVGMGNSTGLTPFFPPSPAPPNMNNQAQQGMPLSMAESANLAPGGAGAGGGMMNMMMSDSPWAVPHMPNTYAQQRPSSSHLHQQQQQQMGEHSGASPANGSNPPTPVSAHAAVPTNTATNRPTAPDPHNKKKRKASNPHPPPPPPPPPSSDPQASTSNPPPHTSPAFIQAFDSSKRRFSLIVGRLNRHRARQGRTDFFPAPVMLSMQDEDVRVEMAREREREGRRGDGEGDEEDGDGEIPASLPLEPEVLERIRDVTLQMEYHMDNFVRDPSYALPPLLRPTPYQRAQPHDPFLDLVPIPEVRERVIRYEGEVDVEEFVFWFLDALRLHPGDALQESTWELDAPFFMRYPFIADERLLERTNRHRQDRGQAVVPMEEIERRMRKWEARKARRRGS